MTCGDLLRMGGDDSRLLDPSPSVVGGSGAGNFAASPLRAGEGVPANRVANYETGAPAGSDESTMTDDTPVITPDDLPDSGGEIIESGTFDCPCGADPDCNICFLDEKGLKVVTHLRCRACGRVTPFWVEEGE